jgi:hypothetical protein
MQATAGPYAATVACPRPKPRFAAIRATLVALGAALLAMMGVHEH